MSEPMLRKGILQDASTWFPVAFLSFIEDSGEPVLHQMWVNVLGATEWRPVETRNIREMTKAYRECQSFSESKPDDDFRE